LSQLARRTAPESPPPFRLGLIVEHVVNAIFSTPSTEERSRGPLCDNF